MTDSMLIRATPSSVNTECTGPISNKRQYILWIQITYILYSQTVHSVFTECTVCKYRMFCLWIQNVLSVFTECSVCKYRICRFWLPAYFPFSGVIKVNLCCYWIKIIIWCWQSKASEKCTAESPHNEMDKLRLVNIKCNNFVTIIQNIK